MRTSARFLNAAIPLALVALLGVPLLLRLTSVPPPQPILDSITEPAVQATPRAVALPYSGRTAGADLFRLQLTSSDAQSLASSDEIHLSMATYATAATLLEGWLSVDGTPCRFRTPPGAVFVDNALLAFRREPACASHDGDPTGTVQLEIRLDMNTGRVALWTSTPPVVGRIQVVADGETLAVQGQTLRWPPQPTRTRIELLAYMWQVTPPVLWARLRTIAFLVVVGLTLLLWPVLPERRRLAVACAAIGTALVMSGLTLAHAVLFPPLQTPDEPLHAFSLAEFSNDRALAMDVEALSRRTHLERLRHYGNRRFREIDMGKPWSKAWVFDPKSPPPRIQLRSRVTSWWWTAIGPRGTARASAYLWAARRANAVLFGTFCGAAIVILALGLRDARPAALCLALLAVPTLPFFASYVSDTAILVSIGVLMAACVAVLVIGSDHGHRLGVPLAVALGLVWLSGRAVWPLVIAVSSVLVGRAFTGGRPGERNIWHTVAFWTPVTFAASGGLWMAQRAGVFEYLHGALRSAPPGTADPLRMAVALAPWILPGVPIALGVVEWLSSRLTWRLAATRHVSAVIALSLAAWLVVGFLASLFIAFPLAPPALTRGGEFFSGEVAARYVEQVLRSMAVPFRLWHHDELLSTFFWSGMGWVDIVAPVWLLNLVIGATMVAIVWSLLQARADAGRVLRYLALLAGLAISLVLYALGAYGLTYVLYGRYLVGWYLLIVVTGWTAPALSARAWWPWLVGALAVHAYYLQSIPARYF